MGDEKQMVMKEEREKWVCHGCDGECVLDIYPNPDHSLTDCVFSSGEKGKDLGKWSRLG